MAETQQIIRLRGDEDIHAVRTVIARAQGDRVLLVVPRGHAAFRRLVRLKLLVRQAHDRGKMLALVTRDPEVRDLARELDLSVFRSVSAGQRARRWGGEWRAAADGQRKANLDAGGHARGEALHRAPPPVWRTGREAVLARRRELGRAGDWGERIALMGLSLGVLIVLAAVLVLIVPGAEITLVPRQEPLAVSVPFVADPALEQADLAAARLPAQVVSVVLEGTGQTPTSGRRDVPDAPARGTVLFVNLTGQEVPVPAGTIASTSAAIPVKFRTLQAVTVPAGVDQRAVAPVEAVQPGLTGNVGAMQINQIEGPAGVVLRVLNPDPVQGATIRLAAVVTAADKEQLREQIRQRLNQEAATELAKRVPADARLLPETMTVELLTEAFDHQVDEQADVLSLLLRVRVSALAVPQRDLERLASRALREQVPPGYDLLDSDLRVRVEEAAPAGENTARATVRAEGVVGARIDGGQVRALIRGQPLAEARAILIARLPLAADPAIDVRPNWWSRIPYLPLRIFVRVAALPPGS